MNDVQIWVVADTASPMLAKLKDSLALDKVRRAVATACVDLTKNYLLNLPPNRRGWPSTGFYKDAARGTTWDNSAEGIIISVENENAPGAMRFRYHGGTINASDKLLTIPARPEFYGHRAGEFTNLRFVMFASGAKALVIGTGGTGRQSWKGPTQPGTQRNITGAGARTAMMIAYWLVDSVTQVGNSAVIPSHQAYYQTATQAVLELVSLN